MSIYGVSAVTNKNSAYDGFDEETDEELLERLLFKVQNQQQAVIHIIMYSGRRKLQESVE